MVNTAEKIFFTLLLFFCCADIHSENYIEYARIKYLAKEAIIDENTHMASIYFDSLYNNYDFMYASDCLNAVMVAVKNNDSITARKFILKGIEMGIPKKMFIEHFCYKQFLENSLNFDFWNGIPKECIDSLRAIYDSKINKNKGLIFKIDSLSALDQKYTRKVNISKFLYRKKWRKQVIANAKALKEIIKVYGIPEEKLIGIVEKFNGYGKITENKEPTRNTSYIMLIHYFSDPIDDWEEWKELLYKEVVKGNLQPFQFASICDFVARYNIRGDRTGKDGIFYNWWHYDPNETRIDEVNKRRAEIGLPDFNFNTKWYDFNESFRDNDYRINNVVFTNRWD